MTHAMTRGMGTPEPQPATRPIDHLPLMGAADAPALILRSGIFDYAALERLVGRMAGWLRHLGQGHGWEPGARIASWTGKGLASCVLPLAAPRAGYVHVPVNPVLKRAQVSHILQDSGAAMILANKGRLDSLGDGDVPGTCLAMEESQVIDGLILPMPDASSVEEPFESLPPSRAEPDDLAAILYTSGSTGKPKGVMLSHANLMLGAQSVARYLGLDAGDRTLAVLPLAFDYGQNQLFSTWHAGGAVVPIDYLLPREVVRAIARHHITTLAAVPPLWVQLLEQDWPAEAVAPLKRLTNSGGALGEPMVRRLRTQFPDARLFAMYGLTEAFRSTFLDPGLVDEKPTSIGSAIPFAEVMVVRDDGEIAGPGEEGELVHAGPLVAQGYWRDAERSAERFRPAPASSHYGGTAVWSGDRVRIGDDGLLYFVGRRDAMIKSLGQRVSPQDIEDAALATGLVAESVALGVADPQWGQAIHLVARPATGTTLAEAAEGLTAALARDLPNFMQPRAIHWRESLPRGATGKLDRVAIAKELET